MNQLQESRSPGGLRSSRLAIAFLIVGMIGLVGSWAITDPTVEKINMVAGSFLFFGLFVLLLFVKLQRQCENLQKQIDEMQSSDT